MKNKIKSLILFLLGIIILLFLILKFDVDISILYSIKYPQYLLLGILLFLTTPFVLAMRMKYLLLALKEPPKPIKTLATIEYMNKFFFNTFPARLNIPTKAVLLNKICKVRLRNGVSVTVFEYVLDLSMALILASFGMLIFFSNIEYVSKTKVMLLIFLILGTGIIFFNLPPTIFNNFIYKLESEPIHLHKKICLYFFKTLKTIRETWTTIIYSKELYSALLFLAIRWALLGIIMKILFLSMEISVPLIHVLVVEATGIFFGGLSNIPGGLGVREATMVLLFGVLNIPYNISIAVVILFRMIIFINVIIGYILLVKFGYSYLEDK